VGKERPVRKADDFNTTCEPINKNMWGVSTSHNPVTGIALPFFRTALAKSLVSPIALDIPGEYELSF
jgi:hypothetical protein